MLGDRRPASASAHAPAVLFGDLVDATLTVLDADLGDLRAGLTISNRSIMRDRALAEPTGRHSAFAMIAIWQ
jgi:hypothetical protein